jgi:hypothetical protein
MEVHMTIRVSHSKINLLRSPGNRQQSERCLRAQEIERLDGMRPGDAIICTNGVLWVTQAGDPADYLLKKGKKFVANGVGLVLVQAFDGPACRWCVNYESTWGNEKPPEGREN